ncbi:alpha-amylase family glycosyl hydrolase [Longitalea luteola]|uniref:alpha-amylase family glycosyl hydrolase n=1 Tax=Longitalea luteola TaxID=2812563 RepID=UPI001A96E1B5|nr:alpha-amylase family glycosyl hydrolase [Longitalea luteola]
MQRRFSPVAWSLNSNIYEVNVRQYTPEGTFNAFATHLPRLKEMGVEILWFMPITPISKEKRQGTLGSYYACSDYKAINPEFGTLADFRSLVKKAHDLGLKVIIDWVANHTGWDHIWTKSNPEYYKKDHEGKFYDTNNWHDVIDLNYYDHGMRKAMIDAMGFWVKECDIDGFRCDMCHLVPLDFWFRARVELDAIKPLFWLGETQDVPYLQVFDCLYGWRWMSATQKYFRQEITLGQLKDVLNHYTFDLPADTFPMLFTSNHDENTWNGTEYEKYGEMATPLAVFNFTWNAIPLLYTAQELPLHKRLPFFDKDEINWNGTPQLHAFYKTLLQLRKQHPALKAGDAATPQMLNTSDNERILAFVRRHDGKELLVVLNFSNQEMTVQLPGSHVQGKFTNAFTGEPVTVNPSFSLDMKAWDYLVLVK